MQRSEALCDDVLIALKRITRAIDIHSRKLMQTSGLTGPQLLILQVLNRKGMAIPIGELAGSISLSQGTVTSIVERLLKKNLIEKTRSTQDKRKVYISLTDSGRQALQNAPTPLQKNFIESFEKLQDWEQTLILSSLQRVAHMMNAQDLDIEPILDMTPIADTLSAEESVRA
jgi:DNA-binding MarR family transcriptional regulator